MTTNKNKRLFQVTAEDFKKIPGSPIAYWLSRNLMTCYDNMKIENVAKSCKGIDTGNNDLFLRLWHEVMYQMVLHPSIEPLSQEIIRHYRWVPYNKGGSYRKWFGNNEYVVRWEFNGNLLRSFHGSNLRNKDTYFQQGLTWSTVTSGASSFRFFGYGYLFDNGGSCLFSKDKLLYIQGLLNSCVTSKFLECQPTLNTQPGTIGATPYVLRDDKKVEQIVDSCIGYAIEDWDSFETSWDFVRHPLAFSPHYKED